MTLAVLSTGSEAEPWRSLRAALVDCRKATLARTAGLDDEALSAQPDAAFSPIGWHLGHIAYTEALWLAPGADPHPEWAPLFRADGMPKAARRRLPPRPALTAYLEAVRSRVLAQLADGPPAAATRLWHFVLQHEAQHAETIAFLRRLARFDAPPEGRPAAAANDAFIEIPAGAVEQGHDGPAALDNERPAHAVILPAFRLQQRPVDERHYRDFIDSGGYRERSLWSAEGWEWRRAHGIEGPLHWAGGRSGLAVHGVSAYEAEAYCRFAGARLPSEAEWERAAQVAPELALMGEVWHWTSTDFAPYPGFEAFPYTGYSAVYFDGRHRVLRGGSWASLPCVLRPSFRNWYAPSTRQIFAGFRCAQDL